MKAVETYHNAKQIAFLQARQKSRTLLWGRGTGKSTAIGSLNYLKFINLPRAKVFFSSSTYGQILTKTLPAIELKWEEYGLKEGFHYVVGRKPPDNYTRPYSPPRKFENVITFFNGFTIDLLSMDRPDLARGGSYDGGCVDEAALVPKEHLDKVLLPSIRGNRNHFTHYLHHNWNLYSSMPWKSKGQYLLEYADKARAYPEDYFYSEATYLDNLVVLGPDYAETLKREMDHTRFIVEVLNQPLRRVPDGFYHRFSEGHHVYEPQYVYGSGPRGVTAEGFNDVDPKALLDIALDFGGWFSCASVWQQHDKEERCVNAFHVKEDGILDDLVDQICEAYNDHKFKRVRLWGEPAGHVKQAAVRDSNYDQMARRFRRHGWYVEICAPAGHRSSTHEQRHYFINDIFSEEYGHLPRVRINQEACSDLIFALLMTSINYDFKKDKSKERDRDYPQEHAPHYTDGLDYYLMQKHFASSQQQSWSPGEPVMF